MKKELTLGAKVLAVISIMSAGLLVFASSSVANITAVNEQNFETAVGVSAGLNTSQVLTAKGEVWVKGQNNYGQLGLGDYDARTEWTQVAFDEKIVSLSSPYTHTVALGESGTVYTWGENEFGIAGNGSVKTSLTTPTKVTASYRYDSIAAGEDFVVGLNAGRLYAWGANDSSQLGTGDTIAILSPTLINTPVMFTSIKAGKNYVIALDVNQHVWAWGNNDHGQLGNGTTDTLNVPTQISDQTFKFINTNLNSETTVAINTNSRLLVWGDNTYGQIGHGSNWRQEQLDENARVEAEIAAAKQADVQRLADTIEACVISKTDAFNEANPQPATVSTPTPAPTPEPVNTATPTPKPTSKPSPEPAPEPKPEPTPEPEPIIVPDYAPECTTESTGAFTPTDTSGMIPAVIAEPVLQGDALTPVQVDGNTRYTYAAVGSQNTYAIDSNKALYGWGNDENGQSGNGINEKTHTQVPLVIAAGTRFTQVDGGNLWAGAITTGNKLLTWGLNTNSSLASDAVSLLAPTEVGSNLKTVIAGKTTGYAVTTDGQLNSWGNGSKGQLGTEDSKTRVAITSTGSALERIAVSGNGVIGLDGNHNIFTWGSNVDGVFGNANSSKNIVKVPTQQVISKFTSVSAGRLFTNAVDEFDNVWSWGFSSLGNVGPEGEATVTPYPVVVPVAGKTKLVAASERYGFAVSENNVLSIWGGGNAAIRTESVAGNVTSVSTGKNHVVLLDEAGHVWNWGDYTQGLLGVDGVNQLRQADPDNTYVTVAGAGNRTLGIRSDGILVGWGDSSNGLLLGEADIESSITTANTKIKFVKLSGSSNHMLGVDNDGIVWAWGFEPYGTFGALSKQIDTPYAVPVKTVTGE